MEDTRRNDKDHLSRSESQPTSDCGCADVNCCAPGLTAGSSSVRRMRTILFAVILLAAVGVAAYSLLLAPATGDSQDVSPGEAVSDAATEIDRKRAELVENLLPGRDFAFVVLSEAEESPGGELQAAVTKAVQTIADRGVAVAMQELRSGNENFAIATAGFGGMKLPAVLALMKGGGSVLVEGEITEANLLKAYLSCCPPSASCCPAGATKTSCDPSACGK